MHTYAHIYSCVITFVCIYTYIYSFMQASITYKPANINECKPTYKYSNRSINEHRTLIVTVIVNNNNNNNDNLYGAVTRPYRYKGASQATRQDKP